MATPNVNNVTGAKPRSRATGAAHWGVPGEVTIPANGVDALDEHWHDLGYLTQDGVTNTIDQDWGTVTAFGGDTVLSVRTSRSESFQFGAIETSPEVLSLVYGPSNVTTDAAGNITVLHNGADQPQLAFTFEFALRGDRIKRIVVPLGQVNDVDDVQYQDGSEDPVTYTPTIQAFPDANGNTAYEYIVYAGKAVKSVTLKGEGGGDPAANVQVGKTVKYSAAVTYADGTTAPAGDGLTLKTSDSKKASVEGLTVTGVAEGTVQITPSFGGVDGAPFTLTVAEAATK